jgi:hypothetical protein
MNCRSQAGDGASMAKQGPDCQMTVRDDSPFCGTCGRDMRTVPGTFALPFWLWPLLAVIIVLTVIIVAYMISYKR